MGDYSKSFTANEIIKMGFMSKKNIPQKYFNSEADLWFIYYIERRGISSPNDSIELHAREYKNEGSPTTLRVYRASRGHASDRRLFKKLLEFEE